MPLQQKALFAEPKPAVQVMQVSLKNLKSPVKSVGIVLCTDVALLKHLLWLLWYLDSGRAPGTHRRVHGDVERWVALPSP